jgi:hypothetical protein
VQLVEDLTLYGDLLELAVSDGDVTRRSLFLGGLSYVRRHRTNSALLVGIRDENAPLIRDELMPHVAYVGHARVFRAPDDMDIDAVLSEEGLAPLHAEQWSRAPRTETPSRVLDYYLDRLNAVGLPGEVELSVLDPASSPNYYRGRWRALRATDTGHFVARRPQSFGADLWCFVHVDDGTVKRLIDLPLQAPLSLGADEAWRLQAAIDALHGTPQRLRVEPAPEAGRSVIGFFSPLPGWARRRLDVIGVQCQTPRGALFAHELPSNEVREEVEFFHSTMWMSVDQEGAQAR